LHRDTDRHEQATGCIAVSTACELLEGLTEVGRQLVKIRRQDRIQDAPSYGDDQPFLYMEDTNRNPEEEKILAYLSF
jgi:hypothetical protein